MWLRDPLTIEVSRNAVTPLGFELVEDVSGNAIDLTGFVLACNIARVDGLGASFTPTPDIVDATKGQFDIIFDGSAYSSAYGDGKIVLSYEVKADDGGGQSVIVMRGPLVLVPGIN